jgi:hypothetical protein
MFAPHRILASLALLALAAAFPARAAGPRRVTWNELPTAVVGRQVSIALPEGVVAGRVTAVEADALILNVARTANAKAYPKGSLRVPRAGLRALELASKTHRWRIIATPLGLLAGLAGGLGAALAISFSNNNDTGAAAALIGITAGGTIAGYLIGNAADRHSVTVEVVEDASSKR